MISLAGQPAERPDLKKPTALRGVVGVWDCESSDRIKKEQTGHHCAVRNCSLIFVPYLWEELMSNADA